jgi:hypothetical protein
MDPTFLIHHRLSMPQLVFFVSTQPLLCQTANTVLLVSDTQDGGMAHYLHDIRVDIDPFHLLFSVFGRVAEGGLSIVTFVSHACSCCIALWAWTPQLERCTTTLNRLASPGAPVGK